MSDTLTSGVLVHFESFQVKVIGQSEFFFTRENGAELVVGVTSNEGFLLKL